MIGMRLRPILKGKKAVAAIDQVRTVDKRRLVKKLGTLHSKTAKRVSESLCKMFAM